MMISTPWDRMLRFWHRIPIRLTSRTSSYDLEFFSGELLVISQAKSWNKWREQTVNVCHARWSESVIFISYICRLRWLRSYWTCYHMSAPLLLPHLTVFLLGVHVHVCLSWPRYKENKSTHAQNSNTIFLLFSLLLALLDCQQIVMVRAFGVVFVIQNFWIFEFYLFIFCHFR